jgi:hypothetical protein
VIIAIVSEEPAKGKCGKMTYGYGAREDGTGSLNEPVRVSRRV